MKIFYAIQVSNTTKTPEGMKWLLRNDACMNIMRGIVMAVLKLKPEWEFVIKVPNIIDVMDLKDYYELFPQALHDRIHFYSHYIPVSPVESRFHFDFQIHSQQFMSNPFLKDIDVMINDENTLLMNWKVLFNFIGQKIPVISTNYFFDTPSAKKTPQGIWYFDRQVESFLNSEIAAFQCEATRDETLKALKKHLKNGDADVNSSVWGVGCSAEEILDPSLPPMNFDVPMIYFGNRITDTAGRYTNWDDFARGIGKLSSFRLNKQPCPDFKALMLDPTRKASKKQIDEINLLSCGEIKFGHLERHEYIRFIRGASISCNLFVNEVHGGVTHAEAMLAKNIVIMPKVNNYWAKMKKVAPNYPFFVKHNGFKIDTTDLARKLNLALVMLRDDKKQAMKWMNVCHKAAMLYETYESASWRIIADIKSAKKMGWTS